MKQPILKTLATLFALPTLGAVGALPAVAQTTTDAPAQAPAIDDAQTQQHAIANINLLIAAFNSKDLDQGVKETLVACIYQNSIREITIAMDKSMAASPGEFDRSNSSQMLGLMAGVCGYQPPAAAAESTPPTR